MTHTICFIDEEVESFTRNKDKFDRIGVNLCLNEYRTVETCHFKDLFSKFLLFGKPFRLPCAFILNTIIN